MLTDEFFEGVRASLVDKDRKPKWRHKSVHDVTLADIAPFFYNPAECNLDLSKENI